MCREALAERLDLAVDHSALSGLQPRSEVADPVILTGAVPLHLARQGGADSSDGVTATVECRVLDWSSETPRLGEVAIGARLSG